MWIGLLFWELWFFKWSEKLKKEWMKAWTWHGISGNKMQKHKWKVPRPDSKGGSIWNAARAYAWWRTRGPIAWPETPTACRQAKLWIKTRILEKSLAFIHVLHKFIAQEHFLTKINKPYIIGKVFQCTLTISNQFNLIPPKLKDSKGNILVHETSNPHNSFISSWISTIQLAD